MAIRSCSEMAERKRAEATQLSVDMCQGDGETGYCLNQFGSILVHRQAGFTRINVEGAVWVIFLFRYELQKRYRRMTICTEKNDSSH